MKPSLPVFAGQGRQHADQEGAFVFAEHEALHIGQVHHHVDDGELQLREVARHRLDGAGLREADADDRVGATLRKAPRRLLALRDVLDLVLQVRLAGLLLPALGTLPGGLAEGFVELAAQLEDEGRLGIGGRCRQCQRRASSQRIRSWL